ncbi:MAG: LysR family transcriptional regulator [Pseudomonadales bacterium]|nr:LysR family transcriptional regulator [Pseudomonadales bacterium]
MSVNIRNVDLNLLKVFDAIMREKHISRAAERLCVSQPTVSNALNRLRVLYEDDLFIRTAKGVTPTSKAVEISTFIRDAIQRIESTLDTGSEFRPETSHRKFTVALTDYGELYFLPHLMEELGKLAPDVEIVCLPTPGAMLNLEMKSGSVDLVWDWKKIDDIDFVSDKIFEDKSFCVARKDHPDIGDSLSLEQFLQSEHVILRPTRTHIPLIERYLENMGLERKVVTEVSHVLVIPAIVASTNLLAAMPERLARHFAKQLNLKIFPNPIFEKPVSVYQMWHKHFENDEGHRWFRNLLADLVKTF